MSTGWMVLFSLWLAFGYLITLPFVDESILKAPLYKILLRTFICLGPFGLVVLFVSSVLGLLFCLFRVAFKWVFTN